MQRAAAGRDRGAATVQLMIATPALLLMLMLIVQAGVWMHATHIAETVAARALEATRAQNGTTADGQHTAQRTLHALAGGTLRDVRVSVTRTATTSQVRITGTAEPLLPGRPWRISAVAAGPNERFVPDTGNGS
jgi:Flp pilus assembly protein TadG